MRIQSPCYLWVEFRFVVAQAIQTLAAGVYYDTLKGNAKLYDVLKRVGL